MPRKYRYRVRVSLVKEDRAPLGSKVTNPDDLALFLRSELDLGSQDREHFVVVHLDVKHRILSHEVVSIGHLSSALVHPREVFKAAILANAHAVVIAHNHPSQDTEPSREDLQLTRRLVSAGELLGIPVLDHVIVTSDAHLSLAARGAI